MKKTQFEWPEFNTDKERITHKTAQYADMDISEAFAMEYGLTVNGGLCDVPPMPITIGDNIKITAKHIDKRRAIFETTNQKSIIYSTGSTRGLEKGHEYVGRVIANDKNGIKVDLTMPIVDKYIIEACRVPYLQRCLTKDQSIVVKDLQLQPGGYYGTAVIRDDSGLEIEVNAFIPGSQIALNIETDFDKWNGSTVNALIINYNIKPDGTLSIICSRKKYLRNLGDGHLLRLYDEWCTGEIDCPPLDGVVTGVINSSKKCGVFVEIPEWNITGLMPMPAKELVNYKPGNEVTVKIDTFDEEVYYNSMIDQMQHPVQYELIYEGDDIFVKYCNLKPVLVLA